MSAFKGAKPGDVVYIELRAEQGFALVEAIVEQGVVYVPIGGDWQRSRLHRDPATARQIKTVFRKLRG